MAAESTVPSFPTYAELTQTRVGGDAARDDRHQRGRIARRCEAKVQGQLEHPSIVPVYDIDQRPDGSTFFTMRRVLGRTLGAILDDLRNGVATATARYTQRELLTAFATVCLTIEYAHSRGVIHRDLKPANMRRSRWATPMRGP